jgi:PEP-CTERM motif-containing protein
MVDPMTKTFPALAAAMLVATAFTATAARATVVLDQRGDILKTFTITTEDTPDLDVVSASARFTDKDIILSTTMAGNIGLNPEGFYVWGINRGAGTDLLHGDNPTTLTTADPKVGEGVPFDTFITMRDDGTSDIVFLGPVDKVTDPTNTIPVTRFMPLPDHAFTVSGKTISITLSRDLFPSQGFDFADFGYNMWSRYLNIDDNTSVADFAPDNTTFKASQAVPEPAAWALMIAGFGLAGASLRARRRRLA